MEGDKKIVEFGKYCPTCVNRDKSPTVDPCDDCLSIPARVDSRRPEHYVKMNIKKRNKH